MTNKKSFSRYPDKTGAHPRTVEDADIIQPLTDDSDCRERSNNNDLTWLQAVCTLLPSRRNYATQIRTKKGTSIKRNNPLYRAAFTLPSKTFKMDVHPHVLISLQRQLSTASLRTRGKSARLSRHSFRFLQKATGLGDGDASNYINFASQMVADEGMTDQEYLTTIRSLPVSMNEKRQVRAKLLQSPESGTLFSAWDQQQQKAKKHLKSLWEDIVPFLYIWKKPMKIIEGRYGTGVVSYFAFLRWLLYLNLAIFCMVFFLIVLPQVVHNYLPTPSKLLPATTSPDSYSTSTLSTSAAGVAYQMDAIANISALSQNQTSTSCVWQNSTTGLCHCIYMEELQKRRKTGIESVQDLLQGTGFMENTALFPGWYNSEVYNVLFPNSKVYSLALAYILVTVIYFLLCLMMMVVYTTDSVRESFKTEDSHLHKYCNLVFGGWDYCIEKREPANMKHESIVQELKSNLAEERRKNLRSNRKRKEIFKVYFGRILANFLVLCILASTLYGIFKVCQTVLETQVDEQNFKSLLIQYLPSITVTAVNIILPIIFGEIVKLEDYAVDFEIKITLIRTVFIRLASVVFLIATFYVQVECEDGRDLDCNFCVKSKFRCWETYVGQQIYKLVILDFIVVVLSVFLMDFPRKLLEKHCACKLAKKIGHQEFDIPKNVLDLVYSQTLCWLGTFYSPLLPAICVLKFFIFFYVKKLTLLVNYSPSTVPYRASRSNTFFVIVLMLSFVLSAVPVGYTIAEFSPSRGCGPFRGCEKIWDVVSNIVDSSDSEELKAILSFLVSKAFGIPVFIVLCLAIYFYSTLSAANQQMVAVLKDQLVLEGKDKSFLLARLTEVTKLSRLPNK